MRARAILLSALFLAACGGGGASPSPPPVVISPPPPPSAASFSEVGVSASGHALFNPQAPHVAVNGHGTWLIYQAAHDYSTIPSQNLQRLVLNGGAGWTTIAEFNATNTPCLVAEPSGAVWVAWSEVHVGSPDQMQVRRWTSPTATAQAIMIQSEQGQNDKFGCAWDQDRNAFWFIGSGFELLRFDIGLQLVSRQDIADSQLPFYAIYPGLKIADDGALELLWVTQDTSQPTTHYRSMHWLRSPEALGAEIANDETGPSLNIAPQHFTASKFPNDWLPAPGGPLVVWWHVPQTGGQCFAAPTNCTLGMRAGNAVTTTFGAGGEIPFSAHGAVLGERSGRTTLVLAYDGRLVWFTSPDRGASWGLGGTVNVPNFGPGQCIRDFDGVETSTGFTGAMAIVSVSCPDWASGANQTVQTRIVGWTLTL